MHRKIGGQGHLKSTLTGHTDNGQCIFKKSGQNPDIRKNRDRQNSVIQTQESLFHLIIISGHRVENPYRSGHVRGQQTNNGQDFSKNPNKNETRKGHR